MLSRRDFLKGMLAVTAGLTVGEATAGDLENKTLQASELPRRPLGDTGQDVSLFSLGGEATVEREDRREEAVEIINRALDEGVNYIDTSPSYGDGSSEENIGRVMASRREEVFLASKTHERGYDGTMRLIEGSLERLQTDYLDLYQLHTIRTEEDLEQIFADDGAIHAMEELRDEGVIENVGITGHYDPDVLLQGIEEYDFDSILMSLNAADVHSHPFQDELLQEAVEQELGIVAMKVMARGRLLGGEGLENVRQALDYVWSLPISTAIVGISDISQLEENIALVREFSSLSAEEMMEIEGRTAAVAEDGNFFKFNW